MFEKHFVTDITQLHTHISDAFARTSSITRYILYNERTQCTNSSWGTSHDFRAPHTASAAQHSLEHTDPTHAKVPKLQLPVGAERRDAGSLLKHAKRDPFAARNAIASNALLKPAPALSAQHPLI